MQARRPTATTIFYAFRRDSKNLDWKDGETRDVVVFSKLFKAHFLVASSSLFKYLKLEMCAENYYGFLKKVQTHRKRKATCTKKKKNPQEEKNKPAGRKSEPLNMVGLAGGTVNSLLVNLVSV